MIFSDYKNVRTIVFEELSKEEKIKYFNFLLENEINFTKEEGGSYVALVKILNPQFYAKGSIDKGQDEVNRSGAIDVNKSQGKLQSGRTKSTSPKPGTGTRLVNHLKKGKEQLRQKTPEKVEPKKLKSSAEVLENNFSKFLKHLNPLMGIRGKKINFYNLKYAIEEIYSIRYIRDSSNYKNQVNKAKKVEKEEKDSFPIFVANFLANKFGKKNLIDQQCLDLLFSVQHYRKENKDVETFAKFLNEDYDPADLIFYLFVRACIENETKTVLLEKAREDIKLQYNENKDEMDLDLYLNIKNCIRIANSIFGKDEEVLMNSFIEKIEGKILPNTKRGKNLIKASTVLEVTLEDYIYSRKNYNPNDNNLKPDKDQTEDLSEEDLIGAVGEDNYNRGFKSNTPNNVNMISTNQSNKPQGIATAVKAKEETKPNREDKITALKNLVNNYIKENELESFFIEIIESYQLNEKDPETEKAISTIKQLVFKKLSLLINFVYTNDKKKWFDSLLIKENVEEAEEHFNLLVSIIEEIQQYEPNQIPRELIEEFGKNLLLTPELVSQINKLIFKHFQQ